MSSPSLRIPHDFPTIIYCANLYLLRLPWSHARGYASTKPFLPPNPNLELDRAAYPSPRPLSTRSLVCN